MARMIAPQGMNSLSVTDSKGRERVLRRDKDGTFHVNNPKLAKKLKQEGLGVAGLSTVTTAEGFTCIECGFGSFFRKCSRCGHVNGTPERDGE
jgi:hypothetical protein